ncbi:dopamine beta-hydroxylase-like isoform X2 [Biomphalaria glabrata]|uniref:Dopamine beta-hydroxylase-like isoform X2 n=1 Tax=Biomphalaria glabrata TaxID=6526 RepID=A0A9W2YJH7_BIOGL|nr:dopamine beta-hydroxylase-like isoform X2 [Biomphalaria glabrata]
MLMDSNYLHSRSSIGLNDAWRNGKLSGKLYEPMTSHLTRLVLTLLLSCDVSGYFTFRDKIPNGHMVPHPCKPNTIWQGVGHFIDAGGKNRNPFGLDFAAERNRWSRSLCLKDSDGDGWTNGQELGDPNCTWTESTQPFRTYAITHPGVCDPWNSSACLLKQLTNTSYETQGDWLRDVCQTFDCPTMNEKGVMSLDLRLKRTPVPAKRTTHMCQLLDLSALPVSYHIVAVKPIIDNNEVVHHMALFGCTADMFIPPMPYECSLMVRGCDDLLAPWVFGVPVVCSHPKAAVKIGQDGYTKIVIQIHWNNPGRKSDLADSSGLTIYYTPKLREHDIGILVVGAAKFDLPAERQSVSVIGTCTERCTRNLIKSPINITLAANHMHVAGVHMSITIRRHTSHTLVNLTNEETYKSDGPRLFTYIDVPVPLYPGDQVITNCTYSTLDRNSTTYFGLAASDEMCFGVLFFYPKEHLVGKTCLTIGNEYTKCCWCHQEDYLFLP